MIENDDEAPELEDEGERFYGLLTTMKRWTRMSLRKTTMITSSTLDLIFNLDEDPDEEGYEVEEEDEEDLDLYGDDDEDEEDDDDDAFYEEEEF